MSKYGYECKIKDKGCGFIARVEGNSIKKLTKAEAVKLAWELITTARNQPDGDDIATHFEHTTIKKDRYVYITITIPYDEI